MLPRPVLLRVQYALGHRFVALRPPQPHDGDTSLKSTGEPISIRFGFASSKPVC